MLLQNITSNSKFVWMSVSAAVWGTAVDASPSAPSVYTWKLPEKVHNKREAGSCTQGCSRTSFHACSSSWRPNWNGPKPMEILPAEGPPIHSWICATPSALLPHRNGFFLQSALNRRTSRMLNPHQSGPQSRWPSVFQFCHRCHFPCLSLTALPVLQICCRSSCRSAVDLAPADLAVDLL